MTYADDVVEDVRQGQVARRFADITPGFGTNHPQDVKPGFELDDPTPIPNSRPADAFNYSKRELGITDAEIMASIREGRPPRPSPFYDGVVEPLSLEVRVVVPWPTISVDLGDIITSISSSATVGTPARTGESTFNVTGLTSSPAVGTPIAVRQSIPNGVSSSAVAGAPAITNATGIVPSSILSQAELESPEAIEAPQYNPNSISSSPTVGTPSVTSSLTGLSSSPTVGTPSVPTAGTLSVTGLSSSAAVETLAVTSPLAGISSSATVDTTTVPTAGILSITGISSSATVGAPAVTNAATVTPNGITSSGTVGNPTITGAATITPTGLSSSSTVGQFVVEDPYTTAWFNACTTPPSAARKSLVDTFVKSLRTAGVLTKLDWMCLLAQESSQAGRVNIITPSKVATATNSPVFTTDRGFAGDGSTSYIGLGENPNASPNQYAQNSACIGIWMNTVGSSGSPRIIGAISGGNNVAYITNRDTSGNELFRINDGTDDTLQANTGSKLGHRGASRTASNVKRGFFNGTRTANLSTTSTAVPNTTGAALRGAAIYTDGRAAAFYFGSGLTDTEMSDLHSALSTYLTAIGAN